MCQCKYTWKCLYLERSFKNSQYRNISTYRFRKNDTDRTDIILHWSYCKHARGMKSDIDLLFQGLLINNWNDISEKTIPKFIEQLEHNAYICVHNNAHVGVRIWGKGILVFRKILCTYEMNDSVSMVFHYLKKCYSLQLRWNFPSD